MNITRRHFLRVGSLSTLGWTLSQALASADLARSSSSSRPRSLILLWLDGGPSQLETFDPHPGSKISGPTKAIATSLKGVQLAEGLPLLAEQMQHVSLIRSMTSKEGDHERGRYLMKTGYRPNPAVIHPSLGAICAAEAKDERTELPRYISILAADQQARGGYLGETYDPLAIGDPIEPPKNVVSPVPGDRRQRRLKGVEFLEERLARRDAPLTAQSRHREQLSAALAFMDSSRLKAFHVQEEPAGVRAAYGETPFGRGCLAARRLVEAGVRCVEVTLSGWDTHQNNFEGHATQNKILDAAFASLLRDLKERGLLETTAVLCAGEFGRTPSINGLEGRDHWTTGYSVALAGAGLQGGRVIGATDPEGKQPAKDPVSVEELYATLLTALGIDPAIEHVTSAGRPIKLTEGKPLRALLR